jgi:hypothetical protein
MLEMKLLNYTNLGNLCLMYYDFKKYIYLCWYVLCYIHYLIEALKVHMMLANFEATGKQHSRAHSL